MSLPSNNLLLKSLLEFGLSEKEAQVYLALLEYDIPTVQEIAKQTGVNRSSTYVVLESLQKRGLVSISKEGSKTRYIPSSPETLLRQTEDESRKILMLKEKMDTILPNLKAIHRDNKYRPNVRVFEGLDGVREVYFDLFATKARVMKVYANPTNIFKALPDFQEHDKERVKRGIQMLGINPATEGNIAMASHYPPGLLAELILIPEEKFGFSSDMAIYGDTVSLVSPKERFGMLIESREMARMLEGSFDLAWEEAKRLNQKHKLPRVISN